MSQDKKDENISQDEKIERMGNAVVRLIKHVQVLEDQFKYLNDEVSSMYKRVDEKIRFNILKKLDLKWHILSLGVAIIIAYSGLIFWVNDKTIKSNIAVSMAKHHETMINYGDTLKKVKEKLDLLEILIKDNK